MMREAETRSATIIPFPAKLRAAERLARADRFSVLELEAAGVCEAASGAWYHDEAIRDEDRIHHA
ncbi:DUF2735 domain-containing protein [Antarcticirhabdus aurantiaca]|uniref:DUF2735 domain-containing protein n=1 Tax=Antarcticirhabdus aurantiaca TaxID=2606717 RepID=A0ACD4NVZ0_9HYPH|nr:DUF2735 domain-containing protein [Antarcticirhabdus aurantiaca]WAJ31019.1 DUF2735 domain-containing protein [Jeongeuplla avenae]